MHKIHYLPLALNDLKGIMKYITQDLDAPQAAEKLLQKIDVEVQKIAENPFRCHVYVPPQKLGYEYRILHINNYSLFYTMEKEKVEIHRVIYSKRNFQQVFEGQETH